MLWRIGGEPIDPLEVSSPLPVSVPRELARTIMSVGDRGMVPKWLPRYPVPVLVK